MARVGVAVAGGSGSAEIKAKRGRQTTMREGREKAVEKLKEGVEATLGRGQSQCRFSSDASGRQAQGKGRKRAGCKCLLICLPVCCLPLSYFDRLTHACVDIQGCPLATPTLARYVNCQARPGVQAEQKGRVRGQTAGNRAQKSNKQMANTKGDGFFCWQGKEGGRATGTAICRRCMC